MIYRFTLKCPGCGRTSEQILDRESDDLKGPTVNCGDCLMDRTEIVEFKLIKTEPVEVGLDYSKGEQP